MEFTKVFMGIDWPAFIMAVRGSPGGSPIEVHTASQNARQEGYGGSGAISDGRVVVWVVAADFLVIYNSVDWGS